MINLIECTSDHEWDAFNASSPQGNVFSGSAYLGALGVPHKRLFCVADNKPIGGVLLIRPDDPDYRAPFAFSLYQGILLAPSTFGGSSRLSLTLRSLSAIVDAVSRAFPRHSLCTHPTLTDLRAFQWCNYHEPERGTYLFRLHYTGVIDIEQYDSFEKYLQTIRSARLSDQKKASKAGLIIEPSTDVDEFIDLYQQTFARQGKVTGEETRSLVKRIVQKVMASGIGSLIVMRSPALTAVSAIVTVEDEDCVYYLFGATDTASRSEGANTALLLHSINSAFLRGKKRFDMVGINSPNRGDFKTSFNAKPTPYYALDFRG